LAGRISGIRNQIDCAEVRLAGKFRHIGDSAVLGCVRAVPLLYVLYPGIRLIPKEKSGKKPQSV